jgi:phospholipid-translocating ATPase
MEGLRTLVITHKLINESVYAQFEKNIKQAKASMHNREENILNVICGLEEEMDFLAVTGVEDKLQENVLETIETLRQAGI